ncbi:pilus assembly protein TadG-related protein [Streptomyces sp. NPDC001922]|uniref:pilus assembly protein TadG-related protein n=1 Tax=Streptomyces sp. NPDC001922 TaxID=3364624 RepID=UPI00368CCF81
MSSRRSGDTGQAFPIYITVVAGLLFLAFAYFAVAQAVDRRSGGQTAADAAALAAAQDARDQLRTALLDPLLDPGALKDLLNGQGVEFATACAEAQSFAARNGADVVVGEGCRRVDDGFTVTVETRGTVGDSIVPGTEDRHARATATAVVEPLCRVAPAPSATESGRPDDGATGPADDEPEEPDEPGAEDPGDDEEKPGLELDCAGHAWVIDPGSGAPLPEAADLFSVHLEG